LARTVLLADDSVTAQNMGRRILIDAGYEVITVNNGSAALKKIHESRPDLIVLDVYMPGYGGLEVCQRVKESSETTRIPVLLTVGKMEPFKPEEARRVRADGHIVKPFEASELLAALTRLEDKIVPQAEPSRSRKGKPEKKTRSWRVADIAATFDDSHSEKIAYLEEVKQRHVGGENGENGKASDVAAAEASAVEAASSSNPQESWAEAPSDPFPAGPKMARPMSVYAAQQLQELPVVADSVPAAVTEAAVAQENANIVRAEETGSSESQLSVEQAPPLAPAEPERAQTQEFTEISSPAEAQSESSSVQAEAIFAQPESISTQPESLAEAPPQQSSIEPSESVPAPRWVAENVALSPEEAALELEREMHEARAASVDSAEPASDTSLETVEPSAAEFTPPQVDESNGATFAAAASASSASAISSAIPQSDSEAPVASEASAAWQNWQHIRDSVMTPQTADAIAESVAEIAQASPSSAPQEAKAAYSADDSAELSSIVDSVLAELKPRLMEEISKKLRK
jgi:CheY-like chemotaxis protein